MAGLKEAVPDIQSRKHYAFSGSTPGRRFRVWLLSSLGFPVVILLIRKSRSHKERSEAPFEPAGLQGEHHHLFGDIIALLTKIVKARLSGGLWCFANLR